MSSSMDTAVTPTQTFVSLKAQHVTGTHILRIDGYSAANRWMPAGTSINTPTFSACGHQWELSYYPNGVGRKEGPASVALSIMDNKSRDGVVAACRLSILAGDGKTAYSYSMGPHRFSSRRYSTSIDVLATPEEREAVQRLAKDDRLEIRCDISITRVHPESRLKLFLRKLLD